MLQPKIDTGRIARLVFLFFICSFPLHSQNKGITIADTVVIQPKKVQQSAAGAVTSENWQIEVTIK